jgi:hypothetical protein
VPGAYLGFQGVLFAAEGEDGDLGFGLEVNDPVEGDSGSGVLADFAYPVYLLAAAAGGDHFRDQEQVTRVLGADFPADGGARAGLAIGLIPVTIPEMLRMLRGTVIPLPRRDHAHRQHWSQWRRRHQYRASQAHRRWNAYADATP